MNIILPGILSQGGPRYKWERYTYEYEEVSNKVRFSSSSYNADGPNSLGINLKKASSYTFNKATGLFTTKNQMTISDANIPITGYLHDNSGVNFYSEKNGWVGHHTLGTYSTIYHIVGGYAAIYQDSSYEPSGYGFTFNAKECYQLTAQTKKVSLIDTVKSDDPNAYPSNGIQDGYWYVRIA